MSDPQTAPICPFALMGPEVAADPLPFFAALRDAAAPVHRDESSGVYVVSRHEHLMRVVRDPETFSNRYDMPSLRPGGLPADAARILAEGVQPAHTLLTNDPPDHARYRTLVERVFTAERVQAMERHIEDIVEHLIDGFVADGKVEIVARFAAPLPLAVIADVLGFPRADVGNIKRWSDAISEIRGLLVPAEKLVANARLVVEGHRYFADLCEARRRAPRDDLVSALVQARLDDGRVLDQAELNSILQQLMVAGNESCTNAMAGGVRRLAEDPALAARILTDARAARIFVEEVIRLESPAQGHFRRATRDTEIGGVAIPAGAMVHVRWASANRDAEVFPHPDAVDVERRNALSHVGFGGGPHFCVGASLGRAELRLGFQALTRRLKTLRLARGNDFACHPIFHLRGLRALTVTFDAEPARS